MAEVAKEYTALKIRVHPETMKYFLSTLKQQRRTIEKRTLSHWTDIDDWCKEPTYIEQWKLELLASLGKYSWAFFLLEPDNLPDRRKKQSTTISKGEQPNSGAKQ